MVSEIVTAQRNTKKQNRIFTTNVYHLRYMSLHHTKKKHSLEFVGLIFMETTDSILQ